VSAWGNPGGAPVQQTFLHGLRFAIGAAGNAEGKVGWVGSVKAALPTARPKAATVGADTEIGVRVPTRDDPFRKQVISDAVEPTYVALASAGIDAAVTAAGAAALPRCKRLRTSRWARRGNHLCTRSPA
jgi:hypothetical protein